MMLLHTTLSAWPPSPGPTWSVDSPALVEVRREGGRKEEEEKEEDEKGTTPLHVLLLTYFMM